MYFISSLIVAVFIIFLPNTILATNGNRLINNECQIKLKEIDDLVVQTTAFFRQNKFNRAYSSAKKASDLAEKYCPIEEEKRLSLIMNLAEIQLKREKLDDARIIFENNLSLAEKVFSRNLGKLNTYLDYLLKLSGGNIPDEKFEQYFLKSLKVKEEFFGTESEEFVAELVKVARAYEYLKKLETSEKYFLQAVEINHNLLLRKKTTESFPMNYYRSFLIRHFSEEGRRKSDEIAKRWSVAVAKSGEKEFMNGKAIKTVEPVYPPIARNTGATGEVLVAVTIDENGKVIEAKAVSGHKLLYNGSVEAAKKWEFLPTFVDGKPVKVSGIIKFNYLDW